MCLSLLFVLCACSLEGCMPCLPFFVFEFLHVNFLCAFLAPYKVMKVDEHACAGIAFGCAAPASAVNHAHMYNIKAQRKICDISNPDINI